MISYCMDDETVTEMGEVEKLPILINQVRYLNKADTQSFHLQ